MMRFVVGGADKTVSLLAKGARCVAQYSAPYVRQGAERLLPGSLTRSNSADENSKLDKALMVAGASLHGVATVFSALEEGSKVLGRQLAISTSHVVANRYGVGAGKVTEDVLFSVGNVGQTFMAVRGIRPKALLKLHRQGDCEEGN